MQHDQDVAVYIGLDWGDRAHAVQLQPAAGGPVEQTELKQRPDALHAWVAQLRQRFGGRPVGIAIEQRKGAVMHALMQYEFLVLYPINPKSLARYREAFHPSGAKDDPTDAALLLDLLRTHRAQLRPWRPATVTARRLQPATFSSGGPASRPCSGPAPPPCGGSISSTTVAGPR